MKAKTYGSKLSVGETELYLDSKSSMLSPGGRAIFKAATHIEEQRIKKDQKDGRKSKK